MKKRKDEASVNVELLCTIWRLNLCLHCKEYFVLMVFSEFQKTLILMLAFKGIFSWNLKVFLNVREIKQRFIFQTSCQYLVPDSRCCCLKQDFFAGQGRFPIAPKLPKRHVTVANYCKTSLVFREILETI